MNKSIVIFISLYLSVIECKKKKSKPHKSSSSQTSNDLIEYIFLALGLVMLLVGLVYLLIRREKMLRAQKLRSIKKALEVKQMARKDKPCTMTQMQKDEAVAWFVKHNWVLEQAYPNERPSQTPMQLIKIKRKQQAVDGSKLLKDYYDAFYIEMKAGSAYIYGVLMFQQYYLTIVFEKSMFSSRNKTGGYNYKIFDGSLKKGVFQGRWYVTDDIRIEAERQSLKEKERNSEDAGSERSFSKGDKTNDDLLSTSIGSKKTKGTFKLFHL